MSSSKEPSNPKSGTVYKKISEFLGSNSMLDPDPKMIESNNTITNPYTNKKKRRYIDMIGNGLYPSLNNTISGECYNKLRKLENDLDVAITKRHCYISDQLQNMNNTTYNHNITRILRLELYNTYHPNSNDPQQNKWIFKLQTKVFNPNNMKQPINYNNNPMEYIHYHPLQTIISRIRIKLDAEALNIDKTTSNDTDLSEIEWNNPNWSHHDKNKKFPENSDVLMDGIEIERNGDKNCKMDIYIYLTNWFIPFEQTSNSNNNKIKKSVVHNNHNALCKVSKSLALLLGLGYLSNVNENDYDENGNGDKRYHTKSEILQCLGYYVRINNLIRNDNSMAIDCNKKLQKIIGVKMIYAANLWKMLVLKKHILAPDPIHIQHQICVSGDIKENAKIYDILVKVPSLIAMEASKLMESNHDLYAVKDDQCGYAMTIDSLNVQISDVLEEIKDQKKQKLLYQQYANDPVSTIDVIVSNQRENLQIIKEFCDNANVKTSQYFAHSSIYPDIKRYLKKKKFEETLKNEQDHTDDEDDNHNH